MDDQFSGGIDVDRPNTARMYDYLLGGSTNFAVDREAVDALLETIPDNAEYIKGNRAFLARAVRYLVQAGIDQFLDLGSGVPTVGNVHEIAHQHDPRARVAYVDIEPVAVHHAQRLLGPDERRVTVTLADLRDPEAVLNAPGVSQLLDFSRPVAVLAVGVLPFVTDDEEAKALMATYRDATAAGSYAAISHISRIGWTEEQMAALLSVSEQTPTPECERDAVRIRALLPGYALVEPGLVPTPRWRPDVEPTEQAIQASNCYCAVGYRP